MTEMATATKPGAVGFSRERLWAGRFLGFGVDGFFDRVLLRQVLQ